MRCAPLLSICLTLCATVIARGADFPAELLEPIRDMTRGIRDEERDAYYQVLHQATIADAAALAQAGRQTAAQSRAAFEADPQNARRKFSLFVDIIKNPDRFRGQPVTLKGYIQRLDEMDAGENDVGLTNLYQVHLFTGDSQGNPYVVVCSEIPPGMPIPKKGNATNDIAVSGYFFKLWAYEAERGNWGAPLILAHRLEWLPPPPRGLSPTMQAALAGGLLFAAATGVFLVLRQSRRARQFREQHAALLVQDSPIQLPDGNHSDLSTDAPSPFGRRPG